MFLEELKARRRLLGDSHPRTILSLQAMGRLYRDWHRYDEAVPYYRKAYEAMRGARGIEHPETLKLMNALGACYWSAQKCDQAVPLYEELVDIQTRISGDNHAETQRAKSNLAVNYYGTARYEDALPLLEAVIKADSQLDDERKSQMETYLAPTYEAVGQYEKAEPYREQDVRRSIQQFGEAHGSTAARLQLLGENRLAQKKYAEAESVLREILVIRSKAPSTGWLESNVKSLVGQALAGQEKFAEAQSLLVDGYNGLKDSEEGIPKHRRGEVLADALKRLVDLYEAWDKPEESAKWRVKLDEARGEKKEPK